MGRPRRSVGAGSPPHRRGKVSVMLSIPAHIGITPAWAGKSLPVLLRSQSGRDHPRVGGEKAIFHPLLTIPKGSPPRGRGKACGRAAPRAQKGDHPRVGGEKPPGHRQASLHRGSPPRGRGKDATMYGCGVSTGITPAWAGKRWRYTVLVKKCQDHPRVGGEKAAFAL